MTLTDDDPRHGLVAGYSAKCRCEPCRASWGAYQDRWRAERLTSPEVQHGRRVTYLCGCRCDDCRLVNAAYNMQRKAKLRAKVASVPHGTVDGYSNYRCRCHRCTAAKRDDTRDYYIRNQLRFLDAANKRRDLKDRDRREVTANDIRRLLIRHDHRCSYCNERSDRLELDHVIPLSRGGRHSIGNLVPACLRCNRSKHAKLLVEWRAR
jgi:5-methylcytosine-specific restriction endonuclease McrA